ncbi:hypothetical protein Tco_0940877 [Tanacetum coccineum]|uniref:Uncharacterized protein n=1 Tax=Tanacetum coccineum TaxID=301880 RepID=A0ABQ5DRI7_9ASTR
MESLSKTTQTVSALKLTEVIVNGDSVSPVTSVSTGAEDNSSSTNETVNTAHSVSIASSKDQASAASYVDDVMFSFFANQFNSSQLDYEDLEQIDDDDLEEMDLKWQVAILTMRVKRFIKKIGRKMDLNDKETVGFDRTKTKTNSTIIYPQQNTNPFRFPTFLSKMTKFFAIETLLKEKDSEVVVGRDNSIFFEVEYEHAVMNLTCLRPLAAIVGNTCRFRLVVEFRGMSLTGFCSCTSRSDYRSVSKQTTQYE